MKINQSDTSVEKINAKRINQCKTIEEIQQYFQEQDRKLWKDKYKFVWGEMKTIWDYFEDREKLTTKCGERLRFLKKRK